MIPFSPPRTDEKTADAVREVLLSGWITTGPKTKLFEKRLSEYNSNPNTIALNSATAGLEIMLRWFGVGEGDEVILPAYTYCATANVCIHVGAKPVLVDTDPNDFNISVSNIEKAITERTKVIMPVDFAGWPCDYDAINSMVRREDIKKKFKASNDIQQKLGRILVLSDSAHSVGARYKGRMTGSLTDVSVFSFHAVKNLTTAEGGAVALNLPAPFDNEEVYKYLCIKTLHGQNKDALAKTQIGNWKYDIVEAGYKCNMMDLQAVIGLVELDRYESETLPRRRAIFEAYHNGFSSENWAQLPVYEQGDTISCYHIYPLRIKGVTEEKRDVIMQGIFKREVAVNVHFIPIPRLSFYSGMGYNMADYPVAYDNFSREISLPVYYNLSDEQVQTVINAVKEAVKEVLG